MDGWYGWLVWVVSMDGWYGWLVWVVSMDGYYGWLLADSVNGGWLVAGWWDDISSYQMTLAV